MGVRNLLSAESVAASATDELFNQFDLDHK